MPARELGHPQLKGLQSVPRPTLSLSSQQLERGFRDGCVEFVVVNGFNCPPMKPSSLPFAITRRRPFGPMWCKDGLQLQN
jgi:hypothetical protein